MAGLTKGSIETLDPNVCRVPVEFQFNPTEITFEKGVTLAEISIPGLDAPLQQFVRGNAEKITMDLFFDATDEGMGETVPGVSPPGVTANTDKIFSLLKIVPGTHAPPVGVFHYGAKFPGSSLLDAHRHQLRTSFQFILESVRQRFTLFSAEGVPLRATLSVVLREYKTLTEQLDQLNLNSPDRTQSRVLQRGQTLSSLAAEHYRRPSEWRRIADANAIRDPRRLDPGQFVLLPPIP